MSSGSITNLYNRLQQGERDGVQKLWEQYFRRLVGLARTKLADVPRHGIDEEDVALSAFDSFCRGAEQGRFPQLADRDDLWQLLATITARKASDLREYLGRDKRNWRRVQVAQGNQESALDGSFLSQLLRRRARPSLCRRGGRGMPASP